MLRAALASLPPTLDEIFARILCDIRDEYRFYALKILQWLIYSTRPLRIEEIIEVLTVETDTEPRFHPESRFPEPRDVLSICSSLTTTNVAGFGEFKVEELRLISLFESA